MDTRRNPFTPRRGAEPPVLVGRDEALASALTACGRLLQGRSGRPVLLIGDRGMGKTALLRAIAREASMHGFVVSSIDCPKDESERDFAALFAPKIREAATASALSGRPRTIAFLGSIGSNGRTSFGKTPPIRSNPSKILST